MPSNRKLLSVLFLCAMLTLTTLPGCNSGTASLTQPPTETPTKPIVAPPTTALTSGGYYYMAVDYADNALCWGQNEWSMIIHTNDYDPTPDDPIVKVTNARSVSASNWMALITDQSNVLWGWGRGYFNSLGVLSDGIDPLPIMNDVAMASNGGAHYVALKTNGDVYHWGAGWKNHTLGLEDGMIPPDQAIKVLDNAIYVHATVNNGYAIQKDGSLWRWDISVLDDGLTSGNQPVKVMDDVVYVRGSLLIKRDGTLWGWESDWSAPEPPPFNPVFIMDNIVLCDAGFGSFAAIQNDGSLWLWGINNYGQIGDGTAETDDTPVKVADNVVDVTV